MEEALVKTPSLWLTIHGRWSYQEHAKAKWKASGESGPGVSFKHGRAYFRRPVFPDPQVPKTVLLEDTIISCHNGHAYKASIHEAGAGL